MVNKGLSTQHIIAKELGISQMTVSRALNDSPLVKEETKKKIRDAARKLGYSINLNARNLATGRMGAVGILAPTKQATKSIYFLPALEGMIAEMDRYQVEMVFHDWDLEDEGRQSLESFAQRIDGLIIFNMGFTQKKKKQLMRALTAINIPYVLIQSRPEIKHPFISIDNWLGGVKGIEHLFSLGHEVIYCFSPKVDGDYEMERRFEGVMDAYKRRGETYSRDWLIETTIDDIAVCLGEVLRIEGDQRPEAFFVFNDLYARALVDELAILEYSVPDDFSIVGFNDFLPYSEMRRPYLTTIRQPFKKLGEQAVNLVMEGNVDENVGISVEPELIIRESCGCATRAAKSEGWNS